MNKNHKDAQELDLTKPRLASYKQKWKRHLDTVYWVDIQLAQRKGLRFYQTRSNAIIPNYTLPAYYISKVVVVKSEVSLQRKRKDTKDNGILLWTKQAKKGPMELRSDFRAAVLMKNRPHHEPGEQVEEPIHQDQYRRWHPSSCTSWWDKSGWNWKWSHIFLNWSSFCYSWFRLQSIAIHCNRRDVHIDTLHTWFFSCTLHMWSHSHRGSRCLRCAVPPSTWNPCCHMFERALFVLVLSPFSSSLTSIFSLSLSTCSLSCTSTSTMLSPPRVETTALTHNEEYCPVMIHNPLTGYEPKLLDNFDYSETSAMIFQDESGDIDTERCGTRRWDYRKSAIFTTVHSGARRTSEPETSLSLSWRKFVTSSVLFRTCKYGETRTRT